GALDVRAKTITNEMALAAAYELARAAESGGLGEERIVPRMDEWEVVPHVAVATAMKAQEQLVAGLSKTKEELYREASALIQSARQTTQLLMREGVIAQAPNSLLS